VKDDECENADYADWRARIDEQDNPCCDPQYPEHHAHPAKGLAKGRGPEYRHPEREETYGQEQQPRDEQRIENALGRLPQEDKCRLILGGRPRSMIEVGDRGPRDLRKSSGREHDETHDAQDAPEESGRKARRPKSTIQGEKVDGPQGKDAQVQALCHDVRRPDIWEPHDQPLGFGRIRSHEHAHDDEDGYEKDAAHDSGQAAPS
jgi:hypothetical protein